MDLFALLSLAAGGTGVAGAAYLGAVGRLHKKQIEILYQPVPTAQGHEDHHLIGITGQYGDEPGKLRGWIDNPGQQKAMIYYGGSSESVELRRSILGKHLPEHTRYFIPYRGFGPNNHLAPREHLLKQDAEDIFDHVKKQHDFVDVIGRSLGTSMASHVAARKTPNHLALVTPFYSVLAIAQDRYRWVPVHRILADWHEVWKDVRDIKIPTIACLAQIDPITPHKFWQKLLDHFPEPPQINWDPGDHNTIAFSDQTWAKIAEFFAQELVTSQTNSPWGGGQSNLHQADLNTSSIESFEPAVAAYTDVVFDQK